MPICCCFLKFVSSDQSQDWVPVNFLFVRWVYPAEWMANRLFPGLDLDLDIDHIGQN